MQYKKIEVGVIVVKIAAESGSFQRKERAATGQRSWC